MAEKQRKPKRKILRAVGQPTHFTRKQIDEAVRKVRKEMGLDVKSGERSGEA